MKYSVDQNHHEIVGGLQSAGFSVMDNADAGKGRLDIIVSKRRYETVCIEIKFGDKSSFKRTQLEFLSQWQGFCGYVKTFEEALKLAKQPEIYALNSEHQRKIKQWLMRHPDKQSVLVSTFEIQVFGKPLWST